MIRKDLTNEQWARALQIFTAALDGATLAETIPTDADPAIHEAVHHLFQQHERAQKLGFLDEQSTLVSVLSRPTTLTFEPGQLLAGRFAVLRLLGRGGMGEVYLAADQRLSETIALKTVKREFAKDGEIRARFLAEVQSSRRVTHPNVCRIFDLFEHQAIPFYSMEYLPGPTLAEVLAVGTLKPERGKLLALQIAQALLAAHQNGILHCDLKPANVILTADSKGERAVITDFGLARAFGPDSARLDKLVAGTPPFMAPELLSGDPPTVASDIYAFGKMLDAISPTHRLAHDCTETDPLRRPPSMQSVLDQLTVHPSRRNWIAGLALGVTATGILAYEISRPRVPLGSRQRIRVNGFHPESGDDAKIVRRLFIMALRQSPLLSVVGDRDYLAPNNATLSTAGLALPLADLLSTARMESANLVIDGELQHRRNGLHLVTKVYQPSSSAPLYETSIAASDRAGLLHLAETAAIHLRTSAFGESILHSTYIPLEQITSSSPIALELYFLSVFAYEKSDAVTSLMLIDQALAVDPDFVLAHHYRGLILTASALPETALEAAEKAYARRASVTERERNWIEWQYTNLTGDWQSSAHAMTRNTTLFPDESIFQRQLAFSLMRLGRYEEALPYNHRAVELDPFSDNNTHELLLNLAEANHVAECSRTARQIQQSGHPPSMLHWALSMNCLQAGDFEGALDHCRQFGQDSSQRLVWSRRLALPALVMLGRFVEATDQIKGDLALNSTALPAEREQDRANGRRLYLGHLHRLLDQPSLAAEQAEYLVHLNPVACNLDRIRDACALAFDLGELSILEAGLAQLKAISEKWPSSHSMAALWLTQALVNQLRQDDAGELFIKAKGSWPDPVTLLYASHWEGKRGLPEAQRATLAELERLRGKVYKYHFAGIVVFGWREQAKCLENLSDLPSALRMYQQVIQCWSSPQARGSFTIQTRNELNNLQRRL